LGSRKDVVELVSLAHQRQMRILLDIVVNHSGSNWIYGQDDPAKTPHIK